jgi:hypothetical protein
MKALFALALLSLSAAANAVTLTQIPIPPNVPGYPAHHYCIGQTFNADDSVNGGCYSRSFGASSGHAGHALPYTDYVFTNTWDVNGNVLTSTYCGTHVVSNPQYQPAGVWTYATGFDATTCYLPKFGSTQISLYVPAAGFNEWFGYITTSADGAYMLLNNGFTGYIYGL